MELRKDYILERWVIVSQGRGARPHEFKDSAQVKQEGTCYFCPGNERETPKEIGRSGSKQEWVMRWFPNKFPAVDPSAEPSVKTTGQFFTHGGAYGHHEVVVETPLHNAQLYDLEQATVQQLLGVYAQRMFWLSKDVKTKYVLVFKNHGKNGGTSLVHSHSQIISLGRVPSVVQDEVDASAKLETCPYCTIMDKERSSDRKCFENEDIVAFAPYASRFNYEVWVFPKRHVKHILELEERELAAMAEVLLKVLRKLKVIGADYNYFLHYAPDGANLHFHIEIAPRIAIWAGFELCGGVIINSVSPEDAALFYRS